MSLPPEVLARLGDDATPEEAIKAANRGTATYVDNLKQPDGDDNDARFAWYGMLAAAAMRECEASREANAAISEIPSDLEKVDLMQAALGAAMQEYDALRNWRNRR